MPACCAAFQANLLVTMAPHQCHAFYRAHDAIFTASFRLFKTPRSAAACHRKPPPSRCATRRGDVADDASSSFSCFTPSSTVIGPTMLGPHSRLRLPLFRSSSQRASKAAMPARAMRATASATPAPMNGAARAAASSKELHLFLASHVSAAWCWRDIQRDMKRLANMLLTRPKGHWAYGE